MVLLFVNLEPMSFWLVGGRFHAVSRVLQKSEKGVSKVFYGYFKCVLRKTARCSKEISPKFQWCCKQGSFKEVSKDLHKVLLGVYLCQCLKVLFKRSIIIWGLTYLLCVCVCVSVYVYTCCRVRNAAFFSCDKQLQGPNPTGPDPRQTRGDHL